MSIVRSPVRSVVRSPVRGVFGGSASLLDEATSALGGVAPYHYLDFISNRALYASVDVGNVTQATGYTFTRASQGYYTNADGTLTLFGSGAMRRGNRGVLIEGARTNLLLRSQEFDNASWAKNDTTVTANATTAPDGTATAEKLIAAATNAVHNVTQAVTIATATTYTFSAFCKAGEYGFAVITTGESGGAGLSVRNAIVNLTTGALISETVTGMTVITALSNGWYRISVTTAATTGGGAPTFRIAVANTGSASAYLGDGTSGIFLWGAQLEAASFPSSYIPTTTTSVLRSADVLTYTAGLTYGLGLWAEFERAVDTGGNETVGYIDDGDGSDRAWMYVSASDLAAALTTAASVGQSSLSIAGAMAINTTHKMALRVATNSVQMASNGTLATEDTVATNPAAPTRWLVGSQGSLPLFGYIRRIAAFNFAPTDAQLQAMTT